MRQLLNTLYVQTDRAYVHLDHDTLRVEVERETRLRVPLLQLAAIVCFGDVLISPAMVHRCAEDGRGVTWLDRNGRFKARLEGPTSGNVLLRRAQHLALSDPERRRAIARNLLAGKLRNARSVLLRGAREATDGGDVEGLRLAALQTGIILERRRVGTIWTCCVGTRGRRRGRTSARSRRWCGPIGRCLGSEGGVDGHRGTGSTRC